MTSAEGLRKNRKRYGRGYWEAREFLPTYDSWTLEEKQAYQLERLRNFMQYARDNSDFYRERIPQDFIADLQSPSDLRSLPILDKETLRENIDRVFTVDRKNATEGHTGGTTGKSLVVRSTIPNSFERMAQLDHFKSVIGFENRKMRRASFTGKHIIPFRQTSGPLWRLNRPTNQLLFSSLRLSPDNAKDYVAALNKYRPHALDGFPSAMAILARYMLQQNITLEYQPIGLFPTAETLTAELREVLETAFGAPAYDQYASSEGAPFIYECPSRRLHIKLNSGVFEPGPDGNTLVTSFTTEGTPLIRYDIGDRVILDEQTRQCECGIEEPLALRIDGRAGDFLTRADGAHIYSGQTSNILKNVNNSIVEAQFRQDSTAKVTLLLVIDQIKWSDADLKQLNLDFTETMGPGVELKLEFVSAIERAPSGKHRLIVSNL